MTVQATIDYGSIEIEVNGSDIGEFESEMVQLLRFLEDHEEEISSVFKKPNTPIKTPAESKGDTGNGSNEADTEATNVDGPFEKLASQFKQITEEDLSEFLFLEEDQDFPILHIQDESILGDKKTKRQRNTALVLLYLWNECYGEERVKSTELKDAIQMSGISQTNLGNIYKGEGNNLFDRSGRGASATVGLTPPGQREAKDAIIRLGKELRESDTEENGDDASRSLQDF